MARRGGQPLQTNRSCCRPLRGRGQEAWELAQATHIPYPCPVASAWLPELMSTGSFEHGWPNGLPGAGTAPTGEQAERLGDCTIRVSVRLQEERGRVREWVGGCQAPHFPQCWQKATAQNSPAGRHKSPPPMGRTYLHASATPVGFSIDKGGLQNDTLQAGGLN